MAERPSMVVLVPIAPAPTGNGLAMRAQLLVDAAAVDHDVVVVVVPVAGRIPGVVAATVNEHVRVVEVASMPSLTDVMAVVSSPVVAVLACRLAMAELAVAVADELRVPLVIDADDDDVAFHLQAGAPDAAAHWHTIGAACLPRAAAVLVASPTDRAPMAERYGLGNRVVVIANAVDLPLRTPVPAPGGHNLLMVANFTYAPNVDAAVWFVVDVLALLDQTWHLVLVGSAAPEVQALAGDRVTVTGWVSELADFYAAADVVIAPLRLGSGTRIKILEAFAQSRPVVSTSVGVAGIDAVAGTHLRVADHPVAVAAALVAAADPSASASMVDAAATLVREHHGRSKVIGELTVLLRRIEAG